MIFDEDFHHHHHPPHGADDQMIDAQPPTDISNAQIIGDKLLNDQMFQDPVLGDDLSPDISVSMREADGDDQLEFEVSARISAVVDSVVEAVESRDGSPSSSPLPRPCPIVEEESLPSMELMDDHRPTSEGLNLSTEEQLNELEAGKKSNDFNCNEQELPSNSSTRLEATCDVLAQPDPLSPPVATPESQSSASHQAKRPHSSLPPHFKLPLSIEQQQQEQQEQPQSDTEPHEYVVEDILDKKLDANGEVRFLVKWENYPNDANTWEPLDNLRDCEEVMKKYEIKRAQRLARLYGGITLYGEGTSKMNCLEVGSGGGGGGGKERKHKEYKVSEVIGLTEVNDQRYFLVSLQEDAGSAFIRSSLANKLFPSKVIDFYMKNITWKRPTS